MKAYTSRARFDENRRFNGVYHQMGRPHLDSDQNESVRIAATDRRRRSADVVEGSPGDGYLPSALHLVELVASSSAFAVVGPSDTDTRDVPLETGLTRREPESLPYAFRARGVRRVRRRFDRLLDLDRMPIPSDPDGGTYAAQALVLRLRIQREITDDDAVDPHLRLIGSDNTPRRVQVRFADGPLTDSLDGLGNDWQLVTIPRSSLAGFPLTNGRLQIRGWVLQGLSIRSVVHVGELYADPDLPETDFVVRGGDGTPHRAGRMLAEGVRSWIERDWRYTLQPDLPHPPALEVPAADGDHRYLAVLDLWERQVTAAQDDFLVETALDGEDTTFRRQQVSQVRLLRFDKDEAERLPAAISPARLTTNVPEGAFPDRYTTEAFDTCRDACLFPENLSTGEGYRGTRNVHVRVEVHEGGGTPVVLWSRNNGATVVPLASDASADANAVVVEPADANRFRVGDLVVVEDRNSRLDPDGSRRAVLRRLRSVNTATGQLEFNGSGHALTTDPTDLLVGGPLGRAFAVADKACVRRWDGADWLLEDVRYNLVDGITFRFSGGAPRTGEFWSFVARIENPDGGSLGVVEQLDASRVHGPRHVWAPLARLDWVDGERVISDLRARYLPLREVRDRLIELGARQLSPGAFTIVVGDGERTFGDIDQVLEEGVTGDEAIQHAVDRLRAEGGGTLYIRAGAYSLEHPVLLQKVSGVHILGDGDASRLVVSGAGGAFYLDDCGEDGQVEIELLNILEDPSATVTFGENAGIGSGTALPPPTTGYLVPDDLGSSQPTVEDLAKDMGRALKTAAAAEKRMAHAVVATIKRLRALQRQNPEQPLETVAPDELEVLRGLPHGVITVSDSRDVRLRRMILRSEEPPAVEGLFASGVLITGTCEELEIEDCRVLAPYGVVASTYARFLGGHVLAKHPIAQLRIDGLRVRNNQLDATEDGAIGIRVADGLIDGLVVDGNELEGFPVGVRLEDAAEVRTGNPTDRTQVSNNRILDFSEVGVHVQGDGVAVAGNQLRPVGSEALIQAAVHIVGSHTLVADSWIELPAHRAPELSVVCGVLVGDGVDAPLARPMTDIEVRDNRIEAGEGSLASGVVIGGSQTLLDVRIRGNVIRRLGDAAVRSFGHGGPIGSLAVEDNRIDQVALDHLGWSTSVRRELEAVAPEVSGLGTVTSAKAALEVLLGHPNDAALPGLDALLRWLERATARGGIVLSHAEQALVRGNLLMNVGASSLPAGWKGPGAEVRTAALLGVGGFAVVFEGNHIDTVLGAVSKVDEGEGGGTEPGGLPILDKLRALELVADAITPDGGDLYGSLVVLRAWMAAYVKGSSTERSLLQAQVKEPLQRVAAALEPLGSEGKELAEAIRAASTKFLGASGDQARTRQADVLRALLSSGAAGASRDLATTEAWEAAARIDRAMSEGDELLLEETIATRKLVRRLTEGIDVYTEILDRELAALQAKPTPETRAAVVHRMGLVARARGELAEVRKSAMGSDLSPNLRRAAYLLSLSLLERMSAADRGTVSAASLKELGEIHAKLMVELGKADPDLAVELEGWFGQLSEASGLDLVSAGRLRSVLSGLEEASEQWTVDPKAVIELGKRYDEVLEAVMTEALADGAEVLVGLKGDAVQLAELLHDTALAEQADGVAQAFSDLSGESKDVAGLADAASWLGEIHDALVFVPTEEPVPTATIEDETERLASMGQAVIDLRATEDTAQNADGLSLIAEHLSDQLNIAKVGGYARSAALTALAKARNVLSAKATGLAADAAWHSVSSELEDAALSLSAAGASLDTVLALLGVMRRILDTERALSTRLKEIASYLGLRKGALSGSQSQRLLGAKDVDGVLAEVRRALVKLTNVRDAAATDTGVGKLVQALPADGVFTAGTRERVEVRRNDVHQTGAGLTVLDSTGHVLAELDHDESGAVSVEENRIMGCVTAGLEILPASGAQVTVARNHVVACMGLARADQTAFGPASIVVGGEGELTVEQNVLHDNSDAGMHSVLVDWRGDVVVHANRVRTSGAPGAGLLVLTEAVDAELVAKLVSEPALEVEPAPEAPEDDFGSRPKELSMGAFKVATRELRPTYRALELGARTLPAASLANSYATKWVAVTKPTLPIVPLLDFTRFVPIRPVLPIPAKIRRSAAVNHNDVVSVGPALLLLAEGGALVATSVVGNQLESTGSAGAAYLRSVDSTVFTNNRCECLAEVNVAVVRLGQAAGTVSSNTCVGDEPPSPPKAPTPSKKPGGKGSVSVLFDVGGGYTVAQELDPVKLEKLLFQKKDLDVSRTAPAARAAMSAKVAESAEAAKAAPAAEAIKVEVETGFGEAAASASAFGMAANLGTALLDAVASVDNIVPKPEVEQVPPDPRHFSIVVVGGARVAAVGNATTAGVHVHDAQQSIESNV